MENRLKYILILSLLATSVLLFLMKYKLSNQLIQNSWWKVGEPIGLPDVLAFDKINGNYLKNDTIFIANKARAIILTRGFRIFADHKLTLKNIDNQQVGNYYQK